MLERVKKLITDRNIETDTDLAQIPVPLEQQTPKVEEIKEKTDIVLEKPKDNIENVNPTIKYPFDKHRDRRPYDRIDNEILTALTTHKLLTTTKIAELTGMNTKYALKHLEKLEVKGMVSRFKKGVFQSWSYWILPKREELKQ